MSEPRSPVDQLLDLLVYAPVGLALLARDELPRLVEKGRSQADAQVALARMLGQMAAGKGQQELGRMLNEVWTRLGGGGAPGARDDAPAPGPPSPTDAPVPQSGAEPADPAPAEAPAPLPGTEPVEPAQPAGGRPAGELAIPGYDALSAPQVVQRLSGLAPEELEAVRAYEASTRHRQTILGRIAQLQAAGS